MEGTDLFCLSIAEVGIVEAAAADRKQGAGARAT